MFIPLSGFPPLAEPGLPSPESPQGDSLFNGASSPTVSPEPPGRPGPEPPHPTGYSKPTDTSRGDTLSQKFGPSDHLDQLFKTDPESTRFPAYKEKGHSQGSQGSSERKTAHPLPDNATLPAAVAVGSVHTGPGPREPALLPPTRARPLPSTTSQPRAAPTARPAAPAASPPPTAVPAAWTRAAGPAHASATATAGAAADGTGPAEAAPVGPAWSAEPAQSAAAALGPRVGSSAGNQTASQDTGEAGSGGSARRRLPASRRGLPLERWLLVGTLLFGVLFLAVGLLLLGRLLSESLRRKRYSRLDYLINGIYVDI